MIFVKLNFLTTEMVLTDSHVLEKIIISMLSDNTRISAIVITVEGFQEDDKKITYYQNAFKFRNKNPKHPLPNHFEIMISEIH